MEHRATLRPFWYYYGGKASVARHYPPPLYPDIVEPFAGAAGYALRWADRNVTLIDVDPTIVGIWRFLIGATAQDILSIPLVRAVRELPDNLPQGARDWIGFQMNFSVTTPRGVMSSRVQKHIEGPRPLAGWSRERRALMAEQVSAIHHWTVQGGSYSDVPNRAATWFVDPPYQSVAGRAYRFSAVDFPSLGTWCRTRIGQTIVCEGEGADWLPFTPLSTPRPPTSGRKRLGEVSWVSELERE